jgi:hypothetical protein
MAIRNQIRVGFVKEYVDSYATIVLKQGEDFFSEEERTLEETMTTRLTSLSQGNPDTKVDCLIAFDDTGDAYVLGVVGSENQPLPVPDEPGTLAHSNKTDNPIDLLEILITEKGKMSFAKTDPVNGPVELITILIDVIQYIATSTCPPGSPLSNSVQIALEAVKLTNYKKV